MSYDNVCKYLAENYPTDLVQWLLGQPAGPIEVLKTELKQDPLRADSLVLLKALQRILHLEFQVNPYCKPPMPFRSLDYFVRLKKEYGVNADIVQIVMYLRETKSPKVFEDCYQNGTTTHRYRVMRIWEEDPDRLLASPALLPFACLAKTRSPESLLRKVSDQIATIGDEDTRKNLVGCTEVLAGIKFEKSLIRSIFREDIMKESVIYQDILQQGVQKGRQEGRQEGVSFMLRVLRRRLGELPLTIATQISTLSPQKLEVLADRLDEFSQLSDLTDWLAQNT
jgi:predicted transposase/invertase (TIGR01784 family)